MVPPASKTGLPASNTCACSMLSALTRMNPVKCELIGGGAPLLRAQIPPPISLPPWNAPAAFRVARYGSQSDVSSTASLCTKNMYSGVVVLRFYTFTIVNADHDRCEDQRGVQVGVSPACTGGHGTDPYEQNTQQSPGLGRRSSPQPA